MLALVVSGALLTLLGFALRRQVSSYNARVSLAMGRVVDCRERRSWGRSGFVPIVEFITDYGQPVRVAGAVLATPPKPGAGVPLLYDPRRPQRVRFEQPPSSSVAGAAVFTLGFALSSAAFVVTLASM